MTITTKKSGAYGGSVTALVKKAGIYAAVAGLFAMSAGTYVNVGSSAAPMVSMSIRTRAATGVSQLPTGNPYLNFRISDKANNPGNKLRGNFWNAWCNPNVQGRLQDIANVSHLSYAVSYVTGVSGTSSMDQSAGQIFTPTWNNAANGVAGYIMRLDKSVPTAAEFLAAGGSLGSGGTRIVIPPGWFVEHDELTLPADLVGQFVQQIEIGGATSCTFAVTNAGTYPAGTPIAVTTSAGTPVVGWKYLVTGTGVIAVPTFAPNTSDENYGTVGTYSNGFITLSQDFTATAGQSISAGARYPTAGIISNSSIGDGTTQGALNKCLTNKNWTTAGGVTGVTSANGSSYPCPNDLWGSNTNKVQNLAVLGDSTDQGNHDANVAPNNWWGDAYSAEGWVARAFNAYGASFVRAAVSGSSPAPEVLYPSVIRLQKMKYVSRAVHSFGHNFRSATWDGVAGTGFRETMRYWTLLYRAAMWRGDGKMVAGSMFMQATGTFTTAAGQTPVAYTISSTGSQVMYRNFLLAGVFDRTKGDPDMALDTNNWIILDGAANGADMTGVTQASGIWPVHTDWVANGNYGSTLEGTHKQCLYHASNAVRLLAVMPAIMAL